jgi:hypothetical protein
VWLVVIRVVYEMVVMECKLLLVFSGGVIILYGVTMLRHHGHLM